MFPRKNLSTLYNWKKSALRKPLLLRGARQVGKSSLVKLFAESYQSFAEINLEIPRHRDLLREARDVEQVILAIQLLTGSRVNDQDTLIFLDEIQQLPSLINMLRFFLEKRPALHVIAAGSHLEAKIKQEGLSVPVGRVENLYLYPLTFPEYLEATGQIQLLASLREVTWEEPPVPVLHKAALEAFREFMLWGGMPEVINARLLGADHARLVGIYDSLLTGYSEDVFKYASEADAGYLQFVIKRAPQQVCRQFKFENFADGGFRSREMRRVFEVLHQVMLLTLIEPTAATELPLQEKPRVAKKFTFLDIGLVNHASRLQQDYLSTTALNDIYRGAAAEQIVGQELLATHSHHRRPLFYWNKATSEVDFCLAFKDRIVGIEVKSGATGRMRSLHEFSKQVENSVAVRISSGHLKQEQVRNGDYSYLLNSVPFYLVFRLEELLG